MKGILGGLKNKANAIAKEKLDQVKARQPDVGSIRPFEEGIQSALGLEDAQRDTSQKSSRAPSPNRGPPKPTSQGRSDIDPVLESLVQSERRDAVKEEFFKETPEAYTSTHHLNIKAATYNVNGRRPPSNLDLSPWLDLSGHPADIIAIGFQEVVPLTAQNIMLGASLDASSEWEKLLDISLNGPGDREEGHLVPRSADDAPPSPVKGLNLEDRLNDSSSAQPSLLRIEGEHEAEDAKSPRSTTTGTVEADEFEGYLSPAEDTVSMLSDDHISPKTYVQVVGKQMVGVYLTIWVKRSLLKHVRGVQTITVGTGMMGYLGNKGAVMARLRIYDSGVSFVSSHLSSGEQEGDDQKRNADYHDIVRRAVFPNDAESLEPDSLSQKMGNAGTGPAQLGSRAGGQWGSQQSLLEMSHLIWMGDLNYRLNTPDAEARSLVKALAWPILASKDQLNLARKEKKAFQGWEEGVLAFAPTFKFKRGTSTYLGAGEEDQDAVEPSAPSSVSTAPANNGLERGQKQETEKKRTPAWTDRILWRTVGGLRQTNYTSANLLVSDHKPVVANFSFVAREYDRGKVQLVLEAAKNAVHEREAALVPRCELEPHTIEAGAVAYAREKVVYTVLRNRGKVPADWKFVPISGFVAESGGDQEHRIAPKWAKISPEKGSLEPGEAVEIAVTIWIDGGREGSADYLVSKMKSKLDAIILLRIQDGNDVFCSIIGSVMHSCFGLSLSTLATMPRPLDPAEGWESGSPKLRINTQKKQRRRQPSEIPADFYSPMAVLPSPSFDDASDTDGRSRQNSRQASIDLGKLNEPQSQANDTSNDKTNGTGLSSVDQMFEAFSIQNPETSSPQQVESSNLDREQGTEQEESEQDFLIPPELIAMTTFLQEHGGSKDILVSTSSLAQLWSPQTPQSYRLVQKRRQQSEGVRQIRRSLDQGRGVPPASKHQDVAAALLSFFLALPEPLLPREALNNQHTFSGRQSALQKLATYVPPSDLAVIEHMIGFIRGMKPLETEREPQLIRLLVGIWFDLTLNPKSDPSQEDTAVDEFESKIDLVNHLVDS